MELTTRQHRAVRKLVASEGGACWWKVGTGKTRIAYGWFATIAKLLDKRCNFLVVCRREAFKDWENEMKKLQLKWRFNEVEHGDDLNGMFFTNVLPPSVPASTRNAIWIMSHGKLASMRDNLIDVASIFEAVVYDEGFLYKNSQTKHCKSANRISQIISRALILSGSMMTARNLEDIYGQLYAVNRHGPLGRTLTDFRSLFMFKLQIGNSGGARFVNRKGSSETIARRSANCSSVYFPSNDERRVSTIVRPLPASKAQTNAFSKLKEDFYLELEDKNLTLKNTPSLIIKCQQISDGWLKMQDGTIISLSSNKLDYLLGQVGELLACGERVVIWCVFQYTVTLVLQSLQKHFPKIGIYSFTGTTPMDRTGWMKNGRICVATEASGSSVNFLSQCSYAIYYSMGFRWLDLQQSQGRTNRHDSLHKTCYYYFLQTEGSLDSHVYKIVHASSRAEKDLITIAGIKSWLNIKV